MLYYSPHNFLQGGYIFKGGLNIFKGVEKLCDVDGRFEFDSLPGGDYYVIASVFWGDPIQSGAHLMKRVSPVSDEIKEITMTK